MIPGLIAVTVLAWASIALHSLPQFASISALMIGHAGAQHRWGTRGVRAGNRFSLRRIVVTLAGAFAFTTWLEKRLGVDRKLSKLIAAGTSICGASAIVATNTVTEGADEDVAYASAVVTLSDRSLYAAIPGGFGAVANPAARVWRLGRRFDPRNGAGSGRGVSRGL
jgi:hypothetical protein